MCTARLSWGPGSYLDVVHIVLALGLFKALAKSPAMWCDGRNGGVRARDMS